MNTLSWLLYAADVAGSVKSALGAVLVVGGLIVFLCMVFLPIMADAMDIENPRAFFASVAKKVLIATGVLGSIYVVTPSTVTIYLIAASQAGEQIVTSPDGVEIMGDLKAIIKQKLKDQIAPNPAS